MSFLDKLNGLMAEKGINKNQLSQQTGIPYSTIDSFYKKGYDNIKLSTLKRLADFFGCSLDYIADDEVIADDKTNMDRVTEDMAEYLDELHKRPEMKMLFKVAKKASKEDVEKAVKIIEMFKGDSSNDDNV